MMTMHTKQPIWAHIIGSALLALIGLVPAQATLRNYDTAIAADHAGALKHSAVLTEAVEFGGASGIPFDFGAVSGPSTIEFIVRGEPEAGGKSGYLAVGANDTWSLRYEQWNNTGKLGFTHLGVADYQFSPSVDSPTDSTHLAFRLNAGMMQLFVNGTLAASAAAPNVELPTGKGWLGMRNPAGHEGIVGAMARVTVYNSAIAPAAIKRHADAWKARPASVIVLNSDDATISIDGMAQTDTFRGVPFTATVFNGLARFLFAGDLHFTNDDFVQGAGSAAISITVSGGLTIDEGAEFDVSATVSAAGPGGGAGGDGGGGGDGGTGGSGGNGGGGGDGGTPAAAKFLRTTQGGGGFNGFWGFNGFNGAVGASGLIGAEGVDGFSASGVGGNGKQATNRGERGIGALGSTGHGAGGRGGWPQHHSVANGGNATKNGVAGGASTAATPGVPGGGGRAIRSEPFLTGGGGGAGGQGGGGAGGGGGGGGGAGGGGGGGGGSDSFTGGRSGRAGTKGGNGGKGGVGGMGGMGGHGGHGGGAIEFVCYGKLKTAGGFSAVGAGGGAGAGGTAGVGGAAGGDRVDAGGQNTGGGFNGGAGGDGSAGGAGGTGEQGGLGGLGGGGAGGTVMFMASVAESSGTSANVAGGARGAAGQVGRLVFGSNTGGYAGIAMPGSLENLPGLRALNTHLHDFAETPLIPGLIDGADVAGRLNSTNAWSVGTIGGGTPANARVAVARMDTGPAGHNDTFPGYDMLLFVNLTGEAIGNPVIGAGPDNHTAKLRDGGLVKNPVFGGGGAEVLAQLPAYEVYATLIPESTEFVTYGYTPQNSLVLESRLLGNGQTVYLSHGSNVARGAVAATTYPDPNIVLPNGSGPKVNFAFVGEVKINIEPAEAAATQGVGWSLDGLTPVYRGGATATNIPVGAQMARFTQAPGWLPPRDTAITVAPAGGVTTTVTVVYSKAPNYSIATLAPQSARDGEVLGFFVEPGSSVRFSSGAALGAVILRSDGWFSYEPDPADRLPFDLTFSGGGSSRTITVTPRPILPSEQEILALRPRGDALPDPSGRDYNTIHKAAGSRGMNFNDAAQSRIVTITGKQVVFDGSGNGDSFFYEEVAGKDTIQELKIYAEEVIFRSPVHLAGTDVTIYARDLRFEGADSRIDTTPESNSGVGIGLKGGDMTLHVLNMISDPSAEPRLVLGGGDADDGAGGASGTLRSPFETIADFSRIRGGAGSTTTGARMTPVAHTPQGGLPVSYCWLHPIGARAALEYAKDIYYLGFITEAGEQFSAYERLLGIVADFDPLPQLPDSSVPALQFAELRNDAAAHLGRIADKLDFFGNPAGWVPMLSFEVNFKLTDRAITRAMETLYLSHWLTRSLEYLESDLESIRAVEDNLSAENDALRAEMPGLRIEIDELADKEAELEEQINALRDELNNIEQRLLQKANEIVEDRNNVPFWKQALRIAGSIMQVVPVYQPALAAIGGGLDIVSRVDEQDPLDTVLQAVTVAGNYKVATLKKDAAALDETMNPPVFGPPTEDQANRDKMLDQAGKIETALSVAGAGTEALRGFLKTNEAPKDEIDAELARLRAANPQFNDVAVEIAAHMDEKAQFAARLAAVQNRLREIPGIVMKNALAAERLNNSAFELGGVLDPQALSVVNEAARRARYRLRKHFYLLAKSFEYRTLEPYREEGQQAYDPVDVLDKILAILEAAENGGSADTEPGKPHILSPDGFDSLASVFQSELDRLADRIITRYQTRGTEREQSPSFPLPIPVALLPGINGPDAQARFSFERLGILSPGAEAHRIANIDITQIDFELTLNGEPTSPQAAGLLFGSVDVEFVHSGISRLIRDGRAYVFNHFRNGDPGDNPIKWKFQLNLADGSIAPSPPSLADESLLSVLLGQASPLGIQRFSRPAARADLMVRVRNLNIARLPGAPPGDIGIVINGMALDYSIDYFESGGTPEIEVAVRGADNLPLDIKPRFYYDSESGSDVIDENGRRDGLGGIVRSFDRPNVLITPEAFYGNNLALGQTNPAGYQFHHWESQSGGVIGASANGQGDRLDSVGSGTLRVNNRASKRFIAVYEYTGDTTPAEVAEITIDTAASGNGITEYVVRFTEAVVGVDASDFQAFNLGSPLQTLAVSGTGSQRRIRVRTGAATTAAVFSLIDDDSILDLGGNSLAGVGENGGKSITGAAGSGGGDPIEATIALNSVTSTGLVLLDISGVAGSTFEVQFSFDLSNWSSVTAVTLNNGASTIADTSNVGNRAGFYRLMRP